jgi:NADH-quinone oxidoreductase subunit L
LAGVGIPDVFGFAGFYSKDSILESAFAAHSGVGMYAFWMGIIGAVMTAFYSWRLIYLTFHNKPRASHDVMHHVHESPWVMLAPLFVLAAGAIFAGFVWYDSFVGHDMEHFWGQAIHFAPTNEVPHHAHDVPLWVQLLPLAAGLLGILFATYAYLIRRDVPAKIAWALRPLYLLSYNKWYFDEIYDAIFVNPIKALGRFLWKKGDGSIVDGAVDGFAWLTGIWAARRASALQSGYVYHYAFVMLFGIVGLVSWYIFAFGK